jgi:hypothetical protein
MRSPLVIAIAAAATLAVCAAPAAALPPLDPDTRWITDDSV